MLLINNVEQYCVKSGSRRGGETALLKQLMESFSQMDDPRCAYKVEHNLLEILVMAFCGVIANAESWEDIAHYMPRVRRHGSGAFSRFITAFLPMTPFVASLC